ncbi:Telomerase ribonucleoprotein complex RNA binding domain-containing protein, partial [Neurospora intermedia]
MSTKGKSVSFLELDSIGTTWGSKERPEPPRKRPRLVKETVPNPITQTLLSIYYPQTLTLRQYALSKLPKTSRIRRKKIAALGLSPSSPSPSPAPAPASEKLSAAQALEQALGTLLDTTLVCSHDPPSDITSKKEKSDYRWEQWVGFSQGGGTKGDEFHVTLSDGLKGAIYSQSDIVDFVIWLLFSRGSRSGFFREKTKTGNGWPGPRHLLCDGFRKGVPPQGRSGEMATTAGHQHQIPGVYAVHQNSCVKVLKEAPWPQFLMLLGKEGERIMLDLLLDCAVFVSVKEGKGNLVQVSGIPVSELQPRSLGTDFAARKDLKGIGGAGGENQKLSPSEITFARNRMLYARAALNAKGLVHFGLRHIHVLNRFPCQKLAEGEEASKPDESTTHVMMYIFPRQFGLHNVFTSVVDRQQTAQKFQDYTLREDEIAKKFPKPPEEERPKIKIPKRLRGKTQELVYKLQVLHKRCSYAEMLQYYCPLPRQLEPEQKSQSSQLRLLARSSKYSQKNRKKTLRAPSTAAAITNSDSQSYSLLDLATPISSISAFCQAVLSKIIPNDFWGSSDSEEGHSPDHNKSVFLKQIDAFIRLRRFESMTLHHLVQGMKLSSIPWLASPALSSHKCSQTELNKRKEIYLEFLYYTFDSLLIPLIRSNFYVTESSAHRYRLFFFRHDVWLSVTKPALTCLKAKMFEEVKGAEAVKMLEGRKLGFSQVRLLPKGVGSNLRPIMNLRRRVLLRGLGSKGIRGKQKQMLGPSINSVLGPVNSMLKFEKRERPGRLGGGMFAVGDIYQRVKGFRARVMSKEKGGGKKKKFYFVKVDVQAAFDTIPQEAMVKLLKKIPGHGVYKESKHVEVSLPLDYEHNPANNDDTNIDNPKNKPKPTKRWHSTTTSFPSVTTTTSPSTSILPQQDSVTTTKKNTLFIPSHSSTKLHTSSSLLFLAKEHITQNLVKIGKKYYRQKTGIPQGSVLSSTLCNYFYADLQRSQ